MSNTTRPPLLSDDEMQGVALGYYTKEHVKKYHSAKEMYNASYVAVHKIRDIYEAARAKDVALIHKLVGALQDAVDAWDDGDLDTAIIRRLRTVLREATEETI